jgi:diguanylate cyclase (GGDEF)-like protein
VSSHLGEQLKQGVGSGMQIHNHLAVSLRTGQLMMYHYFAPEGQNFWLETAVALKPFLQRQQVLSERYPLFKAWFKGGISSALPVSHMDILLQRENGQYSIFSETLIAPRASTVASEQPARHYVTLPLGENMAFANAILAVDLDVSAFQATKRTLLLIFALLWPLALYATTWLVRRNAQQTMATAVQLLQQYAAGAQPAEQAGFESLQQYALAQQQAQAEQFAQQRVERSEMAFAAQQRTQSLEAEIARRRDSEATLAELRLGLEMANRRLIEANTTLVHDAETDQLTACGNRRAFEQMAAAEISRAIRYAHPVCLLMLDIDFFKRVNDEFGHPMGDQVLIYLADLLRKQIRPSDQLFRWGGEEFALLVPGVSLEQGRVLAEKLRQSVAETTFPHLQPLTISIGVAPFIADFSIEDWVKNADAALYAAKTNGRNRVELAA